MLYVTFASGDQVELHVSEKRWHYDDVRDIVEVQADGDELNAIIEHCPYLRAKQTGHIGKDESSLIFIPNRVQRWFGSDAQHAMSWWPTMSTVSNR